MLAPEFRKGRGLREASLNGSAGVPACIFTVSRLQLTLLERLSPLNGRPVLTRANFQSSACLCSAPIDGALQAIPCGKGENRPVMRGNVFRPSLACTFLRRFPHIPPGMCAHCRKLAQNSTQKV